MRCEPGLGHEAQPSTDSVAAQFARQSLISGYCDLSSRMGETILRPAGLQYFDTQKSAVRM
jgi:hypothetical protein